MGDVKLHESLPGSVARIKLKTPLGFVAQPGDVALLVRGCDRARETCRTIDNPTEVGGKNIPNFKGVRMPINDDLQRIGRQAKS